MSDFLKRFKQLCELARTEAVGEGEQQHVVSAMINGERVLSLVTMRELASWLEHNLTPGQKPCIHFSTPFQLII